MSFSGQGKKDALVLEATQVSPSLTHYDALVLEATQVSPSLTHYDALVLEATQVSPSLTHQLGLTLEIIHGLDIYGPTITLIDGTPLTVIRGTAWTDPGATATDDTAHPISVTISPPSVDTSVLGNHSISYSASDSFGNQTSINRILTVLPDEPPVITLIGDSPMTIIQGSIWSDPGATANDDVDGTLSVTIDPLLINTSIITSTPHIINYSVTDSFNNYSVITRELMVESVSPPAITLNNSSLMTIVQCSSWEDPGATATDHLAATP